MRVVQEAVGCSSLLPLRLRLACTNGAAARSTPQPPLHPNTCASFYLGVDVVAILSLLIDMPFIMDPIIQGVSWGVEVTGLGGTVDLCGEHIRCHQASLPPLSRSAGELQALELATLSAATIIHPLAPTPPHPNPPPPRQANDGNGDEQQRTGMANAAQITAAATRAARLAQVGSWAGLGWAGLLLGVPGLGIVWMAGGLGA